MWAAISSYADFLSFDLFSKVDMPSSGYEIGAFAIFINELLALPKSICNQMEPRRGQYLFLQRWTDTNSARFTDNKCIEGAFDIMAEGTTAFCRQNMRVRTTIDPEIGSQNDRAEYLIEAIREAILNAVIHCDYSIYAKSSHTDRLLQAGWKSIARTVCTDT